METTDFELRPADCSTVLANEYDLVIYALGYERRATKLLTLRNRPTDNAVAFGFDYGLEVSFEENQKVFVAFGVTLVPDLSDSDFQRVIVTHLIETRTKSENPPTISVLVDISCFNRSRLAGIVDAIAQLANECELKVDFFYSIASYSPPRTTYVPNSVVDPVHPSFAGWSRIPANPTAAVIGLGYEQGQALGAIEYLQANPVWAFSPMSSEQSYAPSVGLANVLLLDDLLPENVVNYPVEDPLTTFREVEGVSRGLLQDYNLVLVPFGPKIFVLISLLVAWRHRTIAVWRVSAGSKIEPVQREASEYSAALGIYAKRKLEVS